MRKKNIFSVLLTDEQKAWLEQMAYDTRLSKGEIVKRMMDELSANESFIDSLYYDRDELCDKPICERGEGLR